MVFGLFKKEKKGEDGKYKKPYYSLMSVHSGKVLDLCQDGQNAGHLIVWEGHSAPNQQWTIVQEGQTFLIKSQKNRQFLTVESDQNGAKFFTSEKTGNPNQRFTISDGGNHKQHVIYTYCGKCLDVFEAKKSNGTKVIQWEPNGNKNQLWSFCDPSNITSSSSEIE